MSTFWKIFAGLLICISVLGCSSSQLDKAYVSNDIVTTQKPDGTIVTTDNSKTIKDKTNAGKLLAPFGPSGVEPATRDKGWDIEDGELKSQDKGSYWSAIDNLWNTVRNWFLWLVFIGIGCVVLYFALPASRVILEPLGRLVASIIPIFGSIVENIRAKVVYKKPLEQTVAGVEKLKQNKSLEQRKQINETLKSVQDTDTQKTIKEIKQ